MIETKKIVVPGLDGEVVIKKMGYKSMKEIRNTIRVEVVEENGQTVEKPIVKIGDMQVEFIIRGVESAPFFPSKDVEERRKIVDSDEFDSKIADAVFKEVRAFNNIESVAELKKK